VPGRRVLNKDQLPARPGYNIRRLKQRLIADGILGNLSFIWVPGHAGLEGNELADSIANQGADDSAAGATCDTGSAIEAAVFVPD
jgi:ribonuclease HI